MVKDIVIIIGGGKMVDIDVLTDCDRYVPGKAVRAKGKVFIPCAFAGKECNRHKSVRCAAIYDFDFNFDDEG